MILGDSYGAALPYAALRLNFLKNDQGHEHRMHCRLTLPWCHQTPGAVERNFWKDIGSMSAFDLVEQDPDRLRPNNADNRIGMADAGFDIEEHIDQYNATAEQVSLRAAAFQIR